MSEPPPPTRDEHRFLAGLQATVFLGNRAFSCQAIDLNRHGVMVEGAFDANGHAEAAIHLKTVNGDLTLQARGRVAYVAELPSSGKTRVGIEFEALRPDETDALEQLLSRIIEGMKPASLEQLPTSATVAEVREALSRIPPAHRITLAKRALPAERAFLKHDENPQVIEALCRNPLLTMPEVLQLLRMPALLPTSLELLSKDPRWSSSEEVRIAIATHPRVTFAVAERMVKNLSLVGIRRVIRRPGLNPALKERLVASVPEKQLQGW